MLFDQIYSEVLRLEGGSAYTDDKADRGGKTRFGITEKVARAHGYKGEMKDLPEATAKAIYKESYWDVNRLDEIGALSERIAREVFDSGVNLGTNTAAMWLQRSLNYLNFGQSMGADLTVDGVIGRFSINMIKAALDKRGRDGEVVILRCLNGLQQERYMQITERDSSQRKYAFGWTLQRVVM